MPMTTKEVGELAEEWYKKANTVNSLSSAQAAVGAISKALFYLAQNVEKLEASKTVVTVTKGAKNKKRK